MKVMIFAPHPDDEAIGCGGSIAKHASKGNTVVIVYMTSDKKREVEALNGLKILGGGKQIFLRQKNLKLKPELTKKIISIIKQETPDWIYIPHAAENNLDHRLANEIVNNAILEASFPGQARQYFVKRVLCYEVWTPISKFNYTEDITRFVKTKRSAILEHKSQIKLIRYDEATLSLNRYRGVTTQRGDFCEVFEVIKL